MTTTTRYRARLLKEAALRSACDAMRQVLLNHAIDDLDDQGPELDDGEFRVRRITGVAIRADGSETRLDLLDRTTWGTRPTTGETLACETTCMEVEDLDATIVRCSAPALVEPSPDGDRESATIHLARTSDVSEERLAELIDCACEHGQADHEPSASGSTTPALRRALRALGLSEFAITARLLETHAKRHLAPLVKDSGTRFVVTIDGDEIDVTVAPAHTRRET